MSFSLWRKSIPVKRYSSGFCHPNGQESRGLPANQRQMMLNTDSTKINRPEHNIRMYWTNFWQPSAHVQQNIFEKTLIEAHSPLLYASFGTFFAPKLVNYSRHSESLKYVWKSTNRSHRRKMSSISEFFRLFKDSLCR